MGRRSSGLGAGAAAAALWSTLRPDPRRLLSRHGVWRRVAWGGASGHAGCADPFFIAVPCARAGSPRAPATQPHVPSQQQHRLEIFFTATWLPSEARKCDFVQALSTLPDAAPPPVMLLVPRPR
eukprot:2542921-Prymnesium_polylepis.1